MGKGYIVQYNEASQYSIHKEYTGISARKSWPLSGSEIQNGLERDWMNAYLEDWNTGGRGRTLDAISDLRTLEVYVKECMKQGYDIRILYVSTVPSNEKLFAESDLPDTFIADMGYDLIYPVENDDYYSALNDEREILQEAKLLLRLNAFGMFPTIPLLDTYIDWRNNHLQPMEVEPLSDFVKAHVFLLKDFNQNSHAELD